MRTPPTVESVRLRLASLCARSEQCESAIRRKLMRTPLTREEQEQIVDFLKRERFVDDSRFASAFVRDKMRFNKWSRRKIMAQLYALRIHSSTVSAALEEYGEEEEAEVVAALLRSAVGKCRDTGDSEWRRKLLAAMGRRGFPLPLCSRELKRIIADSAAKGDCR